MPLSFTSGICRWDLAETQTEVECLQNDQRGFELGLLFQILDANLQFFRTECLVEERHYKPQRFYGVLQIGGLAFGPVRKNIFEQFMVPELHLVRDHIYADMENRLLVEQVSYSKLSEAGCFASPGPGQEDSHLPRSGPVDRYFRITTANR